MRKSRDSIAPDAIGRFTGVGVRHCPSSNVRFAFKCGTIRAKFRRGLGTRTLVASTA